MGKTCAECGYIRKKAFNSTLYLSCPRCKVIKKLINKKRPRNNHKNKSLYKSTAWQWCRKYVLLYYADVDLIVKCSTSPHLEYKLPDKNIHVGHYIKYKDGNSSNNSTALEFHNLAPQSARDNVRCGGKQEVLREFLIKTHGIEAIEELENKKKHSLKLDIVTLQEYSDYYKMKYKELLSERNIKDPWR